MAGINAWVHYRKVTERQISRRQYLLDLAEELSKYYAQTRSRNIPAKNLDEAASVSLETFKSSQIRKNCNRNKGNRKCSLCAKVTCKKCIGKNVSSVQRVSCFES